MKKAEMEGVRSHKIVCNSSPIPAFTFILCVGVCVSLFYNCVLRWGCRLSPPLSIWISTLSVWGLLILPLRSYRKMCSFLSLRMLSFSFLRMQTLSRSFPAVFNVIFLLSFRFSAKSGQLVACRSSDSFCSRNVALPATYITTATFLHALLSLFMIITFLLAHRLIT